RRIAAAFGKFWRADLRGRLLRRPGLGGPAPAGHSCDGEERRRDPYRLVLQIDRARAPGRLHRRTLGDAVANAGAENGCRKRRAGTDGARGILRAALRLACAGAYAGTTRQVRG